jgi:uncharacterized RDD family membrane protein YckC
VEEQRNPYAAPKAPVAEYEERREIEPVSKGVRFGEFVVDYIGFFLFAVVVGAFIGAIFGEAGVAALQSIPDILLGVSFMFVYYGFFEGIWARSPGKWIFRTKVVTEEGEKPTFGKIALRTVCRFIPFEAFSFLFAERGWHDKLSGTSVVSTKSG